MTAGGRTEGTGRIVRWFIGDFTLTPQYFESSLSVNCHDSHLAPSTDHKFDLWSVDGESDCRDSLLTNSMQNIGESSVKSPINHRRIGRRT